MGLFQEKWPQEMGMGQAAGFRRNMGMFNSFTNYFDMQSRVPRRHFFHQGARLLTGGNLGNLEIPTIYIPIACDIRIGIESTGDHSSHQKELEPKCVGR